LPSSLEASLKELAWLPLYSHQAQAVNAAGHRRNVMVSTPSASGKTLCYNLPVLQAILEEKGSRALYLFPTKALAQDQLRSLRELACPHILSATDIATFDGDTPQEKRAEIKRRGKLVLTNPDMLHLGILPNHQSWARFLKGLRYVVIDEAHIYRGIFGSHVANVLRRLRRLCHFYGASPQFIASSATIANPEEHARNLVGAPFESITCDGSPWGGKEFVFWNPPLLDQHSGLRRSGNSEAAGLLSELVRHDLKSLVFARTRKLTELIYIYAREELAGSSPELASRIKPYRAGYLPEDRRRIEQELFKGELLGVVATTALELGIDIGGLEATVLSGYPGSIASTWQQAGRSGRRGSESLSFLIGMGNPLDQYFMHHPESFFGKGFEHALINPANPHILKPHLLCAAWELPLSRQDGQWFGAGWEQSRQELEQQGQLRERHQLWFLSPTIAFPAQEINIRAASAQSYAVLDISRGGQLLETVEAANAFFQIHPGAIYLHQGEAYLVTALDLAAHTAYVVPSDASYYTQTRDITEIRILKTLEQKKAGVMNVYLGQVEVTTTVVGFRKKQQFTEEVLGEEVLELPPQRFTTIAFWFDMPPGAEELLAGQCLDFAGGLHATEHAAISLLPLFALCDRNDIGGVSTPFHADTGRANIFIYDGYPGGIGIAEKGFQLVEELWQATLKAISDCPCQDGCPSCVQSPKCGNNNEPLDKRAAQILLECLLGKSQQIV